jgi:uncharacterized membrane protein YccC
MTATPAGQPSAWRLTARSLLPKWSVPAAMRALRATLVVPSMLAISDQVIGSAQMALFAVFGAFASLVLTTFAGSRRDKAIAHLGLALVGSAGLIIGTLASGSAWIAGLVTLPVAFLIYFGGMVGPNVASGVTAALLAYVIAVASSGGVSTIPARLGGWWLASVVSTIAVLTLSPRAPGDRLRHSAAELARAIARHLQAAVDGKATEADLTATLETKQQLIALYDASPYRPIGIATADQALASMISLLEWCTSLVSEAMDGHVDLSEAAPEDVELLAEAAATLRAAAELLDGTDETPDLDRIWHARVASAAHLRGLTGEPAIVRRMADHAFHAQAISLAATAAVADSLVASGRARPQPGGPFADGTEPGSAGPASPAGAAGPPRPAGSAGTAGPARTVGPDWQPPVVGAGRAIAADASIRSVWFRNSARGAIAIAAAVAVARLAGVQHAFWVVLGTLSVLRTSAGATGSTALRALGGTVLGFVVGAALLVGIGTAPAALWTALPLAVLVAAYTPGTAPFVIGQAAFTVTVVVLFNVLAPAGWKVGLLRVEDVAIGCAVSVVVGVLFWPRGASALVGDNLADALRAGAAHLAHATRVALGLAERLPPGQVPIAVATATVASIRLDDSVRAYMTEQGSKRLGKEDLRALTMSTLRLRLTAHSLASLPGPEAAAGPAAEHPMSQAVQDALTRQSDRLARFYDEIAAEVDKPAPASLVARNGNSAPVPVAVPAENAGLAEDGGPADGDGAATGPCTVGAPHYHPEALWVRDHLSHLGSHSASLIEPARRLAALRRKPWWR